MKPNLASVSRTSRHPAHDYLTVARPTPDQPGTLGQQLETISLFLANPYRRIDRDAACTLARRLVIPHARAA